MKCRYKLMGHTLLWDHWLLRYDQVHRTCLVQNRQVRESNCLVPDVGRAICSGLQFQLLYSRPDQSKFQHLDFTCNEFHIQFLARSKFRFHFNDKWSIPNPIPISSKNGQSQFQQAQKWPIPILILILVH